MNAHWNKKLGLLVSSPPDRPGFAHALRLAQTALDRGVEVYLYCIDDAVAGLDSPLLKTLTAGGLKLYACAYSADRRGLTRTDFPLWVGLGSLSDLIAGTDRFVSFN